MLCADSCNIKGCLFALLSPSQVLGTMALKYTLPIQLVLYICLYCLYCIYEVHAAYTACTVYKQIWALVEKAYIHVILFTHLCVGINRWEI